MDSDRWTAARVKLRDTLATLLLRADKASFIGTIKGNATRESRKPQARAHGA
jgi:hypothetical protein